MPEPEVRTTNVQRLVDAVSQGATKKHLSVKERYSPVMLLRCHVVAATEIGEEDS